ncbi:MAG: hypothetical protein ACE5JL_16390 [Dehalococcoidia bacterium]
MLGELLGEASGKTTGVRVLPTEGQQVKVEVSFQGSGKLLGVDMTDTGTYWQTIRPGGVLYGEGHVLMMTKEGEIADFTGFGVGRPTGPSPAAHYGVCGSFQTTSEKLAHLNTIATVFEYDVAEDGSYHWKMWEWK